MNPIWHGIFALVLSYVSFLSLSDKNDTMWLLPKTLLISSQTPPISPIRGPESAVPCDSMLPGMPTESPSKSDPGDISAHVITSVMTTEAYAATPSNPSPLTEVTPVQDGHLLEAAMNETSTVLVKAAFWFRYNVFQRTLLFAQVVRDKLRRVVERASRKPLFRSGPRLHPTISPSAVHTPQFDEPLVLPPSTTEPIYAHPPTRPVVSPEILDENRVLVDKVVNPKNTTFLTGGYLLGHWIQMLVALSTVVLILFKLYNFVSTLISSFPGTSSTYVVGVCFDNESYHWHGQLNDLLQASFLTVGNASLTSAGESGSLRSDQLQYHIHGRAWTLFENEETEISIWSHDLPSQVVDSSSSTENDTVIEKAAVPVGSQGLLAERRDSTSGTSDEPAVLKEAVIPVEIALFSDAGHPDLTSGAADAPTIQTKGEDDPAKGTISSVESLIPPVEQTTSGLTCKTESTASSLLYNSTSSSTLRTSFTFSSTPPLADRIKSAVASANALCIERRGLPDVQFEYARQERLRDPEAMAAWRTTVAEIGESCWGDGITRSKRRALRKLQLQREASQQQQVA